MPRVPSTFCAGQLQEYVEQELEQNPLLERDDNSRDNEAASVNEPNTEAPDPTGGNDSDGSDRVAERSDESADLIDRQNSTEAFDDAFDSDYDNVWTNSDAEMPAPSLPSMDGGSLGLGAGGGSGHLSDDELELEARYSRPPNLREHLAAQIPLEITDATERIIAFALLDSLNGSGYVEADFGELSEQLGCSPDMVDAVLVKLQRLDPPGIFARNLTECLRLQLVDRNRFDPAMEALLDNLDLLAACEFTKLRKICGVDEEDLSDMIADLRSLDPKPAASFDMPTAEPVIPN